MHFVTAIMSNNSSSTFSCYSSSELKPSIREDSFNNDVKNIEDPREVVEKDEATLKLEMEPTKKG